MKSPRWVFGATTLLSFASMLALPMSARAQGVTTGAVSGTVATQQGAPIEGAQVQVTNTSSGARTGSVSRANGRYFIQGLEVGGPYTVSVRRIGYAPQEQANLRVGLGQNVIVDFALVPQATQLAGVTVTSTRENAILSPSHKGVSTLITDSSITRLPTLNRNFTDFVALTPQISTKGPGSSGGGANNRFNAIQIDGSVANDLFGLGSTGQPGGQAGAKQIPLTAVKEYQVVLSPYDVRQGNFTGALINAVTKSGTNEFHGEIFGTYRDEQMERDVAFLRAQPFNQSQFGLSVGGPIVRDRLHFFIAAEGQQQSTPASGPYFGQPASSVTKVPVSAADWDRFKTTLQNQYNYADIGNGDQINKKNPLANGFARFDLSNLPLNGRLVARYNYVNGKQDINTTRSATTFSASNNGYTFNSTTNSGLIQYFSNFIGGGSNEFLTGYTTIRDKRDVPINAPFVTVRNVPNPSGGVASLTAGTENSSQGNALNQDVFEITDNVTVPVGSHRITLGTKNEFFKVWNLFAQNSFGNYTFGSLDSLALGAPQSVQIGVKLDNTDGAARFNARTLGFYAMDEWQATNTLNLSLGLRVDLPALTSQPGTNPTIQSALNINTANVPKNNAQWSPRFGFNWDVGGTGRDQVRGGSGVFVGRPAYVWLSNLFGNSGVNGYGNISCSRAATSPHFPGANGPVPTSCVGASTISPIRVNTADPDLKFPAAWRTSLGYDRQLPWGVVGTFEGLYTKMIQNFWYKNIALLDDPTSLGKDRNGRQLYGTLVNNAPTQTFKPGLAADVIHITNENKDYAYNLTGRLQKRFSDRFEGSVAYTYSHSYDVIDLTSSVAYSNWQFGRAYSNRQDDLDLHY
ncbi:MAG TPA: carboxypeptidase regulatory-like domain-containing protein, partial [Gemmatimonadaceae bacterium]|nr:carboxypeptidase regulatory-like domain-containing protein [Gemmatimonadaceae bacterium]